MWSFILGLIVGFVAKAVFDLFKEEQLPNPMGLNAGRIEGLLDETRQTVRELREEVRQAVAGQGSLQDKATRVLGVAEETVGKLGGAQAEGSETGSPGQSADDRLKLTSGEAGDSATGSSNESGARGRSEGGEGRQQESGAAPSATHGTIQTMS